MLWHDPNIGHRLPLMLAEVFAIGYGDNGSVHHSILWPEIAAHAHSVARYSDPQHSIVVGGASGQLSRCLSSGLFL